MYIYIYIYAFISLKKYL